MNKVFAVMQVYGDGRITLPKELLRQYHLKKGDFVTVMQYPNGIQVIPAKVFKANKFEVED